MKTLTVNVTADHIERGRPTNCASCPIALALKATWKPDVQASTHVNETCVVIMIRPPRDSQWEPMPKHFIKLPTEAIEFIESFDKYANKEIDPIEFTLDIPDDLAQHVLESSIAEGTAN